MLDLKVSMLPPDRVLLQSSPLVSLLENVRLIALKVLDAPRINSRPTESKLPRSLSS